MIFYLFLIVLNALKIYLIYPIVAFCVALLIIFMNNAEDIIAVELMALADLLL